jgi:hypothetical protein
MRTLTSGRTFGQLALSIPTVVVGFVTGSCDGPTNPFMGGPIGTTPSPVAIVTVVSGWDNEPIPATVIVAGQSFTTDWNGRVELPLATGQPLDIDVPGFLPRRTRHLSNSGSIRLWPAATQEEAMAIRDMLYYPGPLGEYFLNRPDLLLVQLDTASLQAETAAIAHARWSDALTTLQELGVRVYESRQLSGEGGELLMTFATTQAQCTDRWGFCLYFFRELYFTQGVLVSTGFESKPASILRGLLSVILREGGANPLPGMMNRERPAAELSLLERQAIKLAFTRGERHRWPDTDRERASVP